MDGDVAGDVGMFMFIGELPPKPMLWWTAAHRVTSS